MGWRKYGACLAITSALLLVSCSGGADEASDSSAEPTEREADATTTTTTPTTVDGREAAIVADVERAAAAIDLDDIVRDEQFDAIARAAAEEAAAVDNLDRAEVNVDRLDDDGPPSWEGIVLPVAWSWNNIGEESSGAKRVSGMATLPLDTIIGEVVGQRLESFGVAVVEGRNRSLIGVLVLHAREYEEEELAGLETHIEEAWALGYEEAGRPQPTRLPELDELGATFLADEDPTYREWFDALAAASPGRWVGLVGSASESGNWVGNYTQVAGLLSGGWDAAPEIGVTCSLPTEGTVPRCIVLLRADPPSDAERDAWQGEAAAGFRRYLDDARAARGLPPRGTGGEDPATESGACRLAELVLERGIGSEIDQAATQPIFDTLPTGWYEWRYFSPLHFIDAERWANYLDLAGSFEPEPGSDDRGLAGLAFIDAPMRYATCVRTGGSGEVVMTVLRGTADQLGPLPIVPYPTD